MPTEALGIFQPDIILRTALVEAFRDLRANPEKLDFVFSSLPNDSLSLKSYGLKEADRAKDWFLKTEIPVHIVPRLDEAKVPCISIKLMSSNEDIVTLGDVHYQPNEDADSEGSSWPRLSTPFNPDGYDPATGIVTVPDYVLEFLELKPGIFLVDGNGTAHEVLEVLSDNECRIKPIAGLELRNSVFKGPRPSWSISLESAGYQETYQIGIHVGGEPVQLMWLHSIVVFCLLHFKQSLLEARGLERTVFSSSDFERNEMFEAELVFSRYIQLTGYVRQYWPKQIARKIVYIGAGSPGYGPTDPRGLRIVGSGNLPSEVDVNDATWIGDLDSLGTKGK